MKKRRAGSWSPKKVASRVKHGYGQGELDSYVPWLGVRDLSSRGTSTRLYSSKTGRTMQFLSNIERDTFLLAEFRIDFVDYWEQWPLDRRDTRWAAECLGVRHPTYIGSNDPVVMTVDGILTRQAPNGVARLALDCKSSDALSETRTQEKLAIVRMALTRSSLPHMLVTEKSLNQQVVRNILWVRSAVRKQGEIEPFAGAFDIWPMRLHSRLLSDHAERRLQTYGLATYCQHFDRDHELPLGWSLRCLKLLMWQHLVEFDLESPTPQYDPVSSLTVRQVTELSGTNEVTVSPPMLSSRTGALGGPRRA